MSYDYLPANKLVAVVEIANADHAVPLCQALIAGGVGAIEITLRTPNALAAIGQAVMAKLPITIGAGTVLNLDILKAAQAAGAGFFVSPAAPLDMLRTFSEHLGAEKHRLIPGVATASEAMTAYAQGFEVLKFFPAEACGGVAWLKSVAGPLPHIRFMPTGGVRENTWQDYAVLDSVAAVGGTWIAPASDIAAGHWQTITNKARAAVRLCI